MNLGRSEKLPDRVVEAGARALFAYEESQEKLVRSGVIEPREWDELPDGCGAHLMARARAAEVLAGVAWSSGFTGLMEIARLICDMHYPEDLMGGPVVPDGDPGPNLVRALRACDEAMAPR